MRSEARRLVLLTLLLILATSAAGCTPEVTDPTRPFDRWPTPTPAPSATPATVGPTATPAPTPTPRPAGPVHSIDDAIAWLAAAGLEVDAEDDERPGSLDAPGRASVTAGSTMKRVLMSEETLVLIYRFNLPVFWLDLVSPFNLTGTYTAETAPTLFIVDNIVFRLRGLDRDVHQEIYTAVWNRAPTTGVAAWVYTMPQLRRDEAAERARRWLMDTGSVGDEGVEYAPGDARLTRLVDFTTAYSLDYVTYGRLPHPDSLVWAVHLAPDSPDRPQAIVLIDFMSDLAPGVTFTDQSQPLHALPEWPLPGPIEPPTLEPGDAEMLVAWTRPDVGTTEVGSERITWFVLERARSPDGPWEAVFEGAHVEYRDPDVSGETELHYRVYGCTVLARRTAPSAVASAELADSDGPGPATPGPPAITPRC